MKTFTIPPTFFLILLQLFLTNGEITESPKNCSGWGSEIQELAHIATITALNGSCSGVIVDQETIMTTATCCQHIGVDNTFGALVTVAGQHSRFTRHCDGDLLETKDEITSGFYPITVDADFNPSTYSHDACLIEGYTSSITNPHAVPILPCSRNPEVGDVCRLVGFVSTNSVRNRLRIRPRHEPVRIVSDEVCTRVFNSTTSTTRGDDVCAEFVEESSRIDDIEGTDGGNAVICGTGDAHCFIGIVSLIPNNKELLYISSRGFRF